MAVARLEWKRLLQPWQRSLPFFALVAPETIPATTTSNHGGRGDVIKSSADVAATVEEVRKNPLCLFLCLWLLRSLDGSFVTYLQIELAIELSIESKGVAADMDIRMRI